MQPKPLDSTAQRHDAASPQHRGDSRVLDSRSLFAGARTVHIRHNGESYLLRMTRLDKLILTK